MKLLIGIFCILSGIVAVTTLRYNKTSAKLLNDYPKAASSNHGSVPVLVELFTSEGCSSCPPADDLLSRLLTPEAIPGVEVIALGEHVDYWNKLGWTDPYSKVDFSQRQRGYAEGFNLDSVYTPQMIVDGHEEFVGGNWNRARAAILSAAKNKKGRIDLALTENADLDHKPALIRLTVQVRDLPDRSSDEDSEVLLAITEYNLQTQVSRAKTADAICDTAQLSVSLMLWDKSM